MVTASIKHRITQSLLTYVSVALVFIVKSQVADLTVIKNMASLLEILCTYPVLENLVAVLPLGDLFNLSKTNSTIRASLHGFSDFPFTQPSSLNIVRPALLIGRHNTSFWKNLKAKSPLYCSERQHTRGGNVKGCLMCSMPVCEACIIKASFGKRDENTFPSRTRSLCIECLSSGDSHRGTSLNSQKKNVRTTSVLRTECICTAKDGYLCLACKTTQNSDFKSLSNQCYICLNSKSDGFSGWVCLWCNLPLPRERSRAESRRDYDARHLYARIYFSYDQPQEEGLKDDIIDTAVQDDVWASSTFTAPALERTISSKKAKVIARDHWEDARKRELEVISERRQFTVSYAEDERWRRSEEFRRSEFMCRAPPPSKTLRPTFYLAKMTSKTPCWEPTASNLDHEDDASLPSYETST